MALTTEDLLEIQGLAARYSHAIDSGDSEGFSTTFSEKGVLSAGELEVEGHDALGELVQRPQDSGGEAESDG